MEFVYNCRYKSRALVIPFNKPTVGPQTDEESAIFRQMNSIQYKASSAIGWAIQLGEQLKSDTEYIHGELASRVRKRLHSIEPRQSSGYSILLYFAEKVR